MNSHDKRHGGYRGGAQGHSRYGDGFGDGFMDETDREVSSLTDRAFRSLCIGEEAIYNDSSPIERHKAFADGPRGMSLHSNGAVEATWQQAQSSSKASSLVGPLKTAEYNRNSATLKSHNSLYQHGNDQWDDSALLSIQKELSEFSSVFQQSITGSSLPQSIGQFHSGASNASSAPSPNILKRSSIFTTPSTRNFFLHSEFSPFQTWKEYNSLYNRDAVPHVPSTSQSPRWYDSPFYKELTGAHRAQMTQLAEQRSHRKQYDNVLQAELPVASTVHQKASAIEKRCDSETAVNCPPWKRGQEPVKNKFAQNRPCTASPLSDRLRQKEEGLVSSGRASATSRKIQTVADDQMSNSGTPFSISQLLTPTIHPRQGTGTSEVLQHTHSPELDPMLSHDPDAQSAPEIKPRNKYKAMASSLLFNLKDNRKRVKSTYTPTMFKSLELMDHSKQPSQLDSLIGKDGGVTSDTPLSWTDAPGRPNVLDLQSVNSPVAQDPKMHAVTYVRGCQSDDYLTLISPKTVSEASRCRSFSHTPQETVSFRYKPADAQSGRQMGSLLTASKSNETPLQKRLDSFSKKASETRSQQDQDTTYKVPDLQGLPQSFNKKENYEVKERDFTKMLRANKVVESAKTREEYKPEAEVNLVRSNTSKERGLFRPEKASTVGDIAALLERDRQLLEAQRGNPDRQNAPLSEEKHSHMMSEFFTNAEKRNTQQESVAMKEKQSGRNKLFREHEVSEIHPSEVGRQSLFLPNEGLNIRQEYRHINREPYDTQGNYCNNVAANKGLHPMRVAQYNPNEAFGRPEQANRAVSVTREDKSVKNEFVVKEQDDIYLQGQTRQLIPSRTGGRHSADYAFVIDRNERSVQELSQHAVKDGKHPNFEVNAQMDYDTAKRVQKNTTLANEISNRLGCTLPSAGSVRYAPIEEFARTGRELQEQRLTVMGKTKHEPVKVQTLIRQYEDSLGERDRNGIGGLYISAGCRESRSGGAQEKHMRNTPSITAPGEGKVLDGTTPNWERSTDDTVLSRQSKHIQNETALLKGNEASLTREKGQTRQEILTSKLKAHAEREIFAIKEKGHANREVHATKRKELHGGKEPVIKNHPTKLDSASLKDMQSISGASVTQRASPSVEHLRCAITGDGENHQAEPVPTKREKEHSRSYIITKTEKINIRQEELQSIARAKIEAIAGCRIYQPRYVNKAHLASPSSLHETTGNITMTGAGAGNAKKDDVPTVKERDDVKTEDLLEKQERARNQGTTVDEVCQAGAHNILLSEETSDVCQLEFESAAHTTIKTGNQQDLGETSMRKEKDTNTCDAPINEDACVKDLVVEHRENKISTNHEKHTYAMHVTAKKEHADNYMFASKESVTARQETLPSVEHVRSKNTLANSEILLTNEATGTVENDQGINESIALPDISHLRLDSLVTRKGERVEHDTLGIQIRSTGQPSPVTNLKTQAMTVNQRQEPTHELADKDRGSVMPELPPSLQKEDKKDALAKEQRTSLKQVAPLSVQHGNKTSAVQERDVFNWEEEEHIENVAQGDERDFCRQEEPSVDHIRIKIISHDKVPLISESIIAIDNSKPTTGCLEETEQVKLDSLASRKREQADRDSHRNTDSLDVKQKDLPPIVHIESEAFAISENLPDKQESVNRDRDRTKLESSQSVEMQDMGKKIKTVDDSWLGNQDIAAAREAECAKNDQLAQKTSDGEDAPPSVDHIRIKIIPHDTNQPVREKIVSIENETVSLHERCQLKPESLVSGQKEGRDDAAGISGKILFEQEKHSPKSVATPEPVYMDRDPIVPEFPQSAATVNETNEFNEKPSAEPETVTLREMEGDKNYEEGINEYIATHKATEEEAHGNELDMSVMGQEEHAQSHAPLSEEQVCFKQDDPLVRHNVIQIVPMDETGQETEKELSRQETAERGQVKLDTLASTKTDSANIKNALGNIERVDGSSIVTGNHRPENMPKGMGQKGEMSPVPTSKEEESVTNKLSLTNEKHLLEPEVFVTREAIDAKTNPPVKKEMVNHGQGVPLSLGLEKENIHIHENHLVNLDVRDIGEEEQTKGEEINKCPKTVNKEKSTDLWEEFSSAMHNKDRVEPNHEHKHEPASKASNSVRQELPQLREDRPIQKGMAAVDEEHKGIQEALPTRKAEFSKNAPVCNKSKSVEHEEKELEEEVETSFNSNDQVMQVTPAGRRILSGSLDLANKEEAKAGEAELPSTPVTKTIVTRESGKAKHGLPKKDRENVSQEIVPEEEKGYLQNKTTAITEDHLTRKEVSLSREGDSTDEGVMIEGRDGVKALVLPFKGKERAHNVRSVTQKIHQAVLADRTSSDDSPQQIKSIMDESGEGRENHQHRQGVPVTRERAHTQNQVIPFDEDLKFKLDALTRLRKERANRYAHRSLSGTNTRPVELAATPHTKTKTLTVDENCPAEHSSVVDDMGCVMHGVSTCEKENMRNVPSENIRNEHASPNEADQETKEAFVMSKKQGDRNYGVKNNVWADSSKTETSVYHRGKLGFLETQVEKDSGGCGHTNTERTKDWHDVVSLWEKEDAKKQVTENEKESVKMETGSQEREFPSKMSIARKGELSATEKGNMILDYLLEKDRDRSRLKTYEVKEKDTIIQELHSMKDPTKQEVLELMKEELIKNEGFAQRANATVGDTATKDREVAEGVECRDKEIERVLPEVLVRKYEAPTESAFTAQDKTQTKQAAETQKEQLFSSKYKGLSENLKEGLTHKVLTNEDHPKQEPAVTTRSLGQETVLTKEREPGRKELFAFKGKRETRVDSLSAKDADYTKTEECTDSRTKGNRRDVVMEQCQNHSENIFTTQDKDPCKTVTADAPKEREHPKQAIVLAKGNANRQLLARKENAYAKPQVFSAHENVHMHPDVNAVTDQAKYHSGKEALSSLSPQRQEYYSKPQMLASDERDISHRRTVVPRQNGKMEMEDLPNSHKDIKEILPLKVTAMREQRSKERAAAHQERQHYEVEALQKQGFATYKMLPITEKADKRHKIPAQFEKEAAEKDTLADDVNDRRELAAEDQRKNENTEGRIIHEQHNPYSAPYLPSQARGRRGAPILSQPRGHITVPSGESYLTVGDAPQSPEKEYAREREMSKGSEEKNGVEEVKRDVGKPGEALQYYAIINHERKVEAGDGVVTTSQRHERTPRKDQSGFVHGESNKGGPAPNSMDYTTAPIQTLCSSTSSPSSGKPVLFKVKDNTLRASPITKSVKPGFQKSFVDDQRPGSSQEILRVLDKANEGYNHLKGHAAVPTVYNATATSAQVFHSRELPSQHSLPSPDFMTMRSPQARNLIPGQESTTAREQPAHSVFPTSEFVNTRSYYRRNRCLEADGRSSVMSTMSEDLGSRGTSTYMENPRERPESACSDIRPLGKPPTVPPKSEKALRRAKRLTTRRIKKAEVMANTDVRSPAEHKPLRAVVSMPSSPTEALPSCRLAPAQPASPLHCVEPVHTPRAPGLVAQPFPLTQRKLLQDPNSGQYFVVDMPVEVKTKTFFDPETGRYVQLSVRQPPEGTRPNLPSVELLTPPPYVLYPGFLPMPVSSLPPLRSASQMSAPAALAEDRKKRGDPHRQDNLVQNHSGETEPYIEPAYGSHGQPQGKPSHDKGGCSSEQNLKIIPMGELEDFAMESS